MSKKKKKKKKQVWLMKSEPLEFSIEDLEVKGRESWDGVRNYQARNFMRDEMRKGDIVLFYHSNARKAQRVTGIAGIARVSEESHPDLTALDPQSSHYDPKSTMENPRWYMVEVQHLHTFNKTISLEEMKACKQLVDFALVKKGNRLSVMPVEHHEAKAILGLSEEAKPLIKRYL